MKVVELKKEMDAQFARVEERFAQIDVRFAQIDDRFARVDEQLAELRREMKAGDEALREEIRAEGETTRRRFEIVAEQMRSDQHVVLDKIIAVANDFARFQVGYAAEHANFARVLLEHDARLNALERKP